MHKLLEWTLLSDTISEANSTKHWTKKRKLHKQQKNDVFWKFKIEKPKITLPCIIKLSRLASRKLDTDNLPVSMKWIRDAIADQIIPGLAPGQADNDPRIEWQYDQKYSKFKAVFIEIFVL